MGAAWARPVPGSTGFTKPIECHRGAPPNSRRTSCSTFVYIGLTIVVFAVLWLLVKGVERFER